MKFKKCVIIAATIAALQDTALAKKKDDFDAFLQEMNAPPKH